MLIYMFTEKTMTMQTLQLNLPNELYQQVKQRAGKTNRTVEAEVIGAVEALLAADDDQVGLPPDVAEEIAQLPFLDDAHLWQAARQLAPPEKNERMQELVLKQQAEGLTEAEQQEAQQLQQYAHRLMMIRAEAAVLLQQRGYDITTLRQPVPPSLSNNVTSQLAS
jgi:hypothetical protein